MLNIPSTQSIFLHTRPTDMRKGFDGLSGIVREAFGADPLDGSGFWLYYKRLEAGTFEVLACDDPCVEIDTTQLAMLLGGVSLVSAEKRRKRYRRAS